MTTNNPVTDVITAIVIIVLIEAFMGPIATIIEVWKSKPTNVDKDKGDTNVKD